jgi:hypothetical protein
LSRLSFAGDRERLARTTPSPDRPVVRPSGEFKGVLPASETGEVVLPNSVSWIFDVEDASLIYFGLGPSVAAPLRGEQVKFIEVES